MMSYSCATAAQHPPLPKHLGLTTTTLLELQGCLLPSHSPGNFVPAPGCGPGALKAHHAPLATERGFKDLLKQPCPWPHVFSHGGNLSNVSRVKGDRSGCSTKNSCTDQYFLSVFHELVFWPTTFIFKVFYFPVHAKDCYSAAPTAAGRHFLQASSAHWETNKIQTVEKLTALETTLTLMGWKCLHFYVSSLSQCWCR